MLKDTIKEELLHSKFYSLLNSEDAEDITVEDLQKMSENIIKIAEEEEEDMRLTDTNRDTNNANVPDDYYLDTDFPIIDLDKVLDDDSNIPEVINVPVAPEMMDTEEEKDEFIKRQIEMEMEKKREQAKEKILNNRIGNSICNYRCSAYTIRQNGYCSICEKKCNGYIESESISSAKMVDIGALCIMNRKDPKVTYISMKDIENLVNGSMALVTEDGTCVVFDNKR